MYKHRPAYPALMLALLVLVIGGLVAYDAHARYDNGEGSEAALLFSVFVTLGAVVICVVGAFARYEFRHLWRHPDPAFSRKARKKRKLNARRKGSLNMYNMLTVHVLLAGVLGLSACSKRDDSGETADAYADLPADLLVMQGVWCVASTNECSMCNVIIDGYTIRLQYRKTADTDLLKKNVSIMTVDEQRSMLVMHNDSGAWPYELEKRPDGDLFLLEFFNSVDHAWSRVGLKRSAERVE